MKIVADDKIPFLQGVFEPFAEVSYLPGKKISAADVADADALIVRTRTRCDSALLAGSKVRFVATATIGFDHINAGDLDLLGIKWSNAPGCNAASVKNYIASTFAAMEMPLAGKTLGIVGVGHVGKLVAEVGRAFDMNLLLNDPPRADAEGSEKFVSLAELLQKSDIVTLHVPLEKSGPYPTVNLADDKFFAEMKPGSWFFNSCRGEAVVPEAFKNARNSGRLAGALFDVWPGEPQLDPELVNLVQFGTPHIAGYSKDGKANGTTAAVRAVARELNIAQLVNWQPAALPPPVFPEQITLDPAAGVEEQLKSAILHVYDIRQDVAALYADTSRFEQLRGSYWNRREFSAFTVKNASPAAAGKLRLLGFNLL